MAFRQFIFTPYTEELLALLSSFEFEAFEEKKEALIGYIEQRYCTDSFYNDLNLLMKKMKGTFSELDIEPINWNAEWESNFQPVIVEDYCVVRASFHSDIFITKYNIIIDPKMAFGTGHHETTYMMITWIKEISLEGMDVLDHGCGTGVLAILCDMAGANQVEALDIEEDAYLNTRENISINGCKTITPILGTIESVLNKKYDIILANINRNVLINTSTHHKQILIPSGKLIMSGILRQDKKLVIDNYHREGFKLLGSKERGNWVSLQFTI